MESYEAQRPSTLTEKLFMGVLFSLIMLCVGVGLGIFLLVFAFVVCCKVIYEIGILLIEGLFGHEQKKKTSKSSLSVRRVWKR